MSPGFEQTLLTSAEISEAAELCSNLNELAQLSDRIKLWSTNKDGEHVKNEIATWPPSYIPEFCSIVFDKVQADPIGEILNLLRPNIIDLIGEQANCVVSMPGYQCACHFDPQYIISLQLIGVKHWSLVSGQWRITPQYGWLDPTARSSFDAIALSPPVTPPSTEVMNKNMIEVPAGTAQHVPPGTWHQCKTPQPSVSLTLSYIIKT